MNQFCQSACANLVTFVDVDLVFFGGIRNNEGTCVVLNQFADDIHFVVGFTFFNNNDFAAMFADSLIHLVWVEMFQPEDIQIGFLA